MSGRDLSKMGAAKVVSALDDNGRPIVDKCPVSDVE